MSGTGSRSKSKKQRNAVSAQDDQNLVLREIHRRNEVAKEDIFRMYRITVPPCQDCRLNTKDATNCWCAFVPPSGGSKKRGIWRKVSDIEAEFGFDPTKDLRSSLDSPAGLTNLGATCYLNSVLQCLYRIRPFIAGFFAVDSQIIQRQFVLRELALLFGQLHSGKRKAVDSAPLAATLELNSSIQQDGQEFLKLLLTSLEGLLGASKDAEVRNVVKNVFRGTLSHVTRCSSCGQESEASNHLVDFYELELNVKGLGNLKDSLNDYLSIEHLCGDNQFFCESCNSRVDATHYTKLQSLPLVLNFQLKRFVFDAKMATKKKVSSKFTFPKTLDMTPWLNWNGAGEAQLGERTPLIYELVAILIHKGNWAHCGHYVANIKDDCTGEWWEYDDELVTSLGRHPLGGVSDATTKELSAKETPSNNSPGEDKRLPEEYHDTNDIFLTSADAYMLMYNVRKSAEQRQPMEACGHKLPDYLRFEIEQQNAVLEDICTNCKQQLEGTLSKVAARKEEVISILHDAPVRQLDEGFYWISSCWLRSWIEDLSPPLINNRDLYCSHDKVPPTKVNMMKCISCKAWLSLHSKYGGGPILSANDCCMDCIREIAKAVDNASSFRDERNKVKQLFEDAVAMEQVGHYFVSKTWLQSWFRRKPGDAPTESDAFPTAAITCPHSGLLPEAAVGAKRVLVPQEMWHYFLKVAEEVSQQSLKGHTSFHIDTPTCCKCEEEMSQVASQEQDLRAIKKEQRQRHGFLLSGESIALFPGITYHLVPSAWLAQWRLYLGESRGKAVKIDKPIGLEASLQSVLCEKHCGLIYRAPKLQRNRRGELVQENAEDCAFTVVSEDDWKDLCRQWNVNQLHSIRALIETCTQANMENSHSNGECEVEDESSFPRLSTQPEICKECTEAREDLELTRKLQYIDENIFIEYIESKELPKCLFELTRGERRVSKRPRRSVLSSNKKGTFKLSGSTTLHQLKMMIWESFDVVKENQRIHFGTTELLDDSATMAGLKILPSSHLWLIDTGVHEKRDIAEDLNMEAAKTVAVEEGFSGTLLARLPRLGVSLYSDTADGSHQLCYDVIHDSHQVGDAKGTKDADPPNGHTQNNSIIENLGLSVAMNTEERLIVMQSTIEN